MQQQIVFKNTKAYWEQEMRQGWYLPNYSSKHASEKVITQMTRGEILGIKQHQVVFRVCMSPPTK